MIRSARSKLALLILCANGCLAAVAQAQSIPPDAPSDLKKLIGEYRSADSQLTIFEADGHLVAAGPGMPRASLRQLSAARFVADEPKGKSTPLEFELDRQGEPKAVQLAGARLEYRDIGSEIVQKIRAGVNADPGRLRATALAAKPPLEPAPARPFDLVNLAGIDPTIKFDIRYASTDNFIGFPLYERSAAYLQRPAAEALGRVEHSLASKGYGLLIHDAYRPWFVTKMFWDATPSSAHVFVADPAEGSRHNRGCAVDLTLYKLESGNAVEMTGRYDEMSPRSYADYAGGTSRQRWLRELLRNAMEAQGFTVYPEEWWHFDYKDWKDYAIGTATFAQLESARRGGSR
ncbi:MAG TPA: M15 family metallopeptidase [Steroidobacteraceae bacterium]|nr:M15 family metallopeptidase [Steroidobacteraceae bacterium]